MILKIQIFSLLYSFFYGVLFFFLLEINYKLIYESKIVYRIIFSLLFVVLMSLLYFLGLVKINHGIVHVYFYLSLFTGYVSSFVIYKNINCKKK